MATVNAARTHLPPSPASAEATADAPPVASVLALVFLLLRFSVVMAALLAVVSLPRSAFFPIREIRVSGTDQVPDSDVLARADLKVGDPRFAVPVADVANRIMRIPRIASADVRLGVGGQVTISVVERIPTAALTYKGEYLLIDRAGVVIEQRQDPLGLPVVRLERAAVPWAQLGARVSSVEAVRALEVLAILPPGVLRPGAQLKMQASGDLVLVTADGITVLLGQPRGLGDRVALLEPLLDAVRRQIAAIEYLDLRFAGNVVVKPNGAVPGRAGVRP